ncbi:MAG: hypothetical protein WBO46_05175 [Caldilineaceae bacterium]
MVQQGGRLGIEEGQIPFDAAETAALGQQVQLVGDFVPDGEEDVWVGQKGGLGIGDWGLGRRVISRSFTLPFCHSVAVLAQCFAAGADLNPLHLSFRALGVGVKDAQAFHFIAKEVDAHGIGQIGRPDIHQSTAAGKGPRLFHHICRFIAGLHPAGQRLFQADDATHGKGTQGEAQVPGGQGHLQQGTNRCHDNRRGTGFALQRGQRGQPGLAGAVGPGDALEGQTVWLRIKQHRRAALVRGGQEVADAFHPLLGLLAAARHNHQRPRTVGRQPRGQKGPGRAQKRQGRGASLRQQLLVGWQMSECRE